MNIAYTLDRTDVARSSAKTLLQVVGVAAAVALGAQIRILVPFTPVPFTLQTLVVLLAPFAVGRDRACAGMLAYLGLGLMGAPLFAASAGMGVTFGYLLGFVAAPAVMLRIKNVAAALVAGLAVIYLLGVTWLSLYLHISPVQAALFGMVPFLPGALVKAMLAYKLAPYVRK